MQTHSLLSPMDLNEWGRPSCLYTMKELQVKETKNLNINDEEKRMLREEKSAAMMGEGENDDSLGILSYWWVCLG